MQKIIYLVVIQKKIMMMNKIMMKINDDNEKFILFKIILK